MAKTLKWTFKAQFEPIRTCLWHERSKFKPYIIFFSNTVSMLIFTLAFKLTFPKPIFLISLTFSVDSSLYDFPLSSTLQLFGVHTNLLPRQILDLSFTAVCTSQPSNVTQVRARLITLLFSICHLLRRPLYFEVHKIKTLSNNNKMLIS